ncbi:hypothetical protein GGF46_001825 [Coemansia sp. RSA 552]|nr:hypothetical protein GGF46_001825 [Coemansia sp. RSA 552]
MRPFGMDGGKDPRLHPMHQRLFATRGRELLPIHRELIRGQQQADSSACTAGEGSAAGSSTVPWSLLRTPPSLDPSLLTAGAAVKLLQAPLAAASIGHQAATQPAAGTAAQETQLTQSLITAAAPLAMVSSPPFSPAGFTGVAPAMFQGFAGQVPWVPQPVATMAATSPAMEPVLATSPSIPLASASPPMLPQITDELYRFVSDGISRGESWAAINNSLRAATGSNWAMTDEQLAQMYQQRSSLISHSSSPPAVPSVSAPAEASTVAAALVSRPKRTRQRISRVRSSGRIAKSKGVKSLAYLNADEFETLQELVRTHGEDWELLGRLMHIRPVDLAKNWPGYSPDTVITRPWTTPETVILDICRNTGIDCRTTAKIIGTKLPLQCRRKTIKAHHVLRDGRRLEGRAKL